MVNSKNQRWELQLKGAGKTPYSRFADGLAVLRSSIREFLCSEVIHSLGIPTTRALSLVTTGKYVTHDMFYDGNPKDEPAWAVEVAERTASMIVKWQGVGFTHGRRYCFANQPDVGLWNMARFVSTLSSANLINEKESDYALERYGTTFMDDYQLVMTKKLGLPKYNKQLISKLLNNMEVDKVDYTNFFRLLSNIKADSTTPDEELLIPLKAALYRVAFEAYVGLLLLKTAVVGVVSEWQVFTSFSIKIRVLVSYKPKPGEDKEEKIKNQVLESDIRTACRRKW
ncbi:hypothetical protein L2E82_27884 [Cichorium intybus]|uniref:Uncharacterized protein n=1 Tax=Cichorium intybus TaxID=13427 RepID=A0ACB9CU99_CICIN|nr:hypothetical protein L2E82_27884 [Cichorium intybus]